jgi:hypothetical protein
MIEVKQIDLSSKKDKKKFFKFAIDLYKDNPHAAPNLYMDEMPEFDPEKNDAFRFCKCKMFLAYKDGKIVGRIAGIWHQGTNMKGAAGQLRFTRLDMIDDFEVTKALFEELKKWGRELGTDEIIGPMSFSDLNEEGMLVEGFDTDSTYIEIYNYPYYVTHMEKLGAYKVVDWNCQRLRIPDTIDERLNRLADQVAEKNGYEMIDVAYLLKNDKPKLDDYIMECLDILDEAYANLYGVSPINEKQKRREMASIYQVLIPEFGALVAKDGKLVAYGFVMPSMLKAMHKGRGHIIPRGFAEYVKSMKHPEVADMMSIGIRHEHKNTGCAAMIVRHIQKGLIEHNVHIVETGPQLEYNRNVQNLWKNYEVISTKLRRCWGLKIDS